MQDSVTVSELDLELLHALQLAPRAPWNRLAPIMGADPVTLARRWQKLSELGIARVTAHSSVPLSNDNVMAHVQIACSLGDAAPLAESLARDPNVFTVHLSSGSFPILLILAARNLDHLTEYLTQRIGHLPGVASVNTHIQTALLIEGSSWELRALSPQKRAEIKAIGQQDSEHRASFPQNIDAQISEMLVSDGRASYADIASALGISLSTARRRVSRLLASKSITLRCDVARHALGWPVAAYLHASFPGLIEPYVALLRRDVPEVRVFSTSASADALHMYLWLHNITDLPKVESRLTAIMPGLVIGERSIMLRTVKQTGHLQDSMGRSTEIIQTSI